MRWYAELIAGTSIAGVLAGISAVAAVGLALGAVKVRGFSLGIAGVLFAGIAFSDVCWNHDLLARFAAAAHPPEGAAATVAGLERARREMLELLREIGLVFFVYSIGMQVGPGFLSSLRAQGMRWNLMAATLVALNLAAVCLVHRWLHVDPVASVGLLVGGVTNTPALAAAEQALRDVPSIAAGARGMAAVGCAVAYPFGVVGTILSLMLVRAVFRVDARREAKLFSHSTRRRQPLGNADVRIANPALAGQRVGSLSGLLGAPVVISRMLRAGRLEVPDAETRLEPGDVLHAVAEDRDLERLTILCGERSDVDLTSISSGQLDVRRLLVTRSEVVGKTLGALRLSTRYGVNVTRLLRAGVELVPEAGVHLHFGDMLVAVGAKDHLADAERIVGNAVGELEHAQLVPVFIGLATGIVLGSIPMAVGGLPAPLRLGLAGGPLLVALIASRLGRVWRVNFYLPNSASLMLRDLGIVLFLGCVGLLSGESFVSTLLHGAGLRWLLAGAFITVLPLLTVEIAARVALKLDYTALCGVVAGAMTSPPALAFASETAGEGTALAYGAVYPLTMILRVVTAQVLVILWVGGSPS